MSRVDRILELIDDGLLEQPGQHSTEWSFGDFSRVRESFRAAEIEAERMGNAGERLHASIQAMQQRCYDRFVNEALNAFYGGL